MWSYYGIYFKGMQHVYKMIKLTIMKFKFKGIIRLYNKQHKKIKNCNYRRNYKRFNGSYSKLQFMRNIKFIKFHNDIYTCL